MPPRPLVTLAILLAIVALPPSLPAQAAPTWSTIAKDNFSRTRSSGWGSASKGGSYAVEAPLGGTTKVAKHKGVAVLKTADELVIALPGAVVADTDVKVTTTVTRHKADDVRYALMTRLQDDGSTYSATLRVVGSERATLSIGRGSTTNVSLLAGAALPFKVPSGKPVHLELKVTGTDPVTITARAWKRKKAPAWQVTFIDSSGALTRAGHIGIVDSVQQATGSVTFTHDDLLATGSTTSVPGAQPPVTLPSPPVLPPLPLPFAHPGIVNSRTQLESVKAMITAGREPWTSALAAAQRSSLARLSRQPKPVAYVQCGPYSNPDVGCTAETDDAQAAYTDALIWYLTNDKAYADKAIEILNAWSTTLKDHSVSSEYSNGLLQAAWAAEIFTKAAELVRYSDAGWRDPDIARFEDMLTTAFLPRVRNGWTQWAANWELSMAEATMNIGVFTDDRSVFELGLAHWRSNAHASIYLTSDGPTPNLPANDRVTSANVADYWFAPVRYVPGQESETCRDLGHASMGLAALVNAAETAQIQGIDLYGQEQERVVAGLEFSTRFLNDPNADGWPCRAPVQGRTGAAELTYAIGYNHYASLGVAMPQTKKWLSKVGNTSSGLHMNWETLTHTRVVLTS